MGFVLPWARMRRRRRKRPEGLEWLTLLAWAANVRSAVMALLHGYPTWAVLSLFFVVWLWNDRPYARGVRRILYEWIIGTPDE